MTIDHIFIRIQYWCLVSEWKLGLDALYHCWCETSLLLQTVLNHTRKQVCPIFILQKSVYRTVLYPAKNQKIYFDLFHIRTFPCYFLLLQKENLSMLDTSGLYVHHIQFVLWVRVSLQLWPSFNPAHKSLMFQRYMHYYK